MTFTSRIALLLLSLPLLPALALAVEPKTKPGDAAPAEPLVVESPAVLAVLEAPATTPAEQIETAQLLTRLERPILAKPYLAKVLAAKLDRTALAKLADKFGTPTFVSFATNEALQPEGGELANRVLKASNEETADPSRLTRLIGGLSSASQGEREDAIRGIERVGLPAVSPLVKVLADDSRKNEHPAAARMIRVFGPSAAGPLVALLDSPNAKEQIIACKLLAVVDAKSVGTSLAALYTSTNDDAVRSAASDAAFKLFGSQLDDATARALLNRDVERELEAVAHAEAIDNYNVPARLVDAWVYDAATGQAKAIGLTHAHLARERAARYGRALLLRETPQAESAGDKTRVFAALAVLGQDEAAWKRDPARAVLDTSLIEQALEAACKPLDRDHAESVVRNAPAAIAAATWLGQFGDQSHLIGRDGEPTRLVNAARSPDARVRFAAVKAIVALSLGTASREHFAGDSYVSQAFGHFATARGLRRALVADPRSAAGTQVAGYLIALGYEAVAVDNGKDAFKTLSSNADYEFAFVHSLIQDMRADELLSQLRREYRTGSLPIGIIELPNTNGTAATSGKAEYLAARIPLVTSFAESQLLSTTAQQVSRLVAKPFSQPLPIDVRLAHAREAIELMGQLAEEPVGWFDAKKQIGALASALNVPELSNAAARSLGVISSAEAQRALSFAAQQSNAVATRRKPMAVAFASSVRKFGVLLPSAEFHAIYDAYNLNAGQDVVTHEVLGLMLEAMQARLAVGSEVSDTAAEAAR